MSEVLATVSASLPRRAFGIGVLLALGGVVLYVGLMRQHSSPGWQVFLLVFGVLVLWLADRMRRATAMTLRLTPDGIYDSDGRELARMDQIVGVDRGAFAIKPSNGFVLRLTERPGRAWAPGLWWRIGRSVGVGGVTSANQTKFMAEMLSAMLAERESGASA